MGCIDKKVKDFTGCKEMMQLIKELYVNKDGKVIGGKYSDGIKFEMKP